MGPHPAVAAIRLAVRRVLHDVLTDHTDRPHGLRPARPRAPAPPRPRPARRRSCSWPAPAAPTPWRSPPPSPSRPPSSASGPAASPSTTASSPAPTCAPPKSPLRLPRLGLDPVESVAVTVGRDGGPEAAARDARYAALDAAAERHGAAAVLLGHTRDDQAETVLLGLARGSGIRSLSGMAAVSGAGRPLPPPLPPARPADRPQGLHGPVAARLGRPAQRRPRLHPLPAAPRGPARPGEGARQGRRRGPRPYRPALPRRRRRPRHLGRRGRAPPYGTRRACWSAPSSTPCRPPYAAGSCAGPPSRPVRPPVRSSPGTSRKSTG